MEKNQDIKLTNFLRAKAAEAERAIRYRPSFFLGMLENDGGYLTVIKLLSTNSVSDGFKKLWEYRRLDLSVEALVVESEWRHAFDPVLIARAEKRLNDVGYRFTRFADV
jgi:5-methylcytosine-specific restriction protein A